MLGEDDRAAAPQGAGAPVNRGATALMRLLVAQGAGWPTPYASLADVEATLGWVPGGDLPVRQRVATARVILEHRIARADRGEFSGTLATVQDLRAVRRALEQIAERLA